MQKSPEAFRTISEVADDLSIPAHVLRFWETKFHQISPIKRGGGRRYYRPDDVRLLRGLQRLLHGDGLTIKGAQKLLREKGLRHVIDLGETAAPAIAAHPQDELARLFTALTHLRQRVAKAAQPPQKSS